MGITAVAGAIAIAVLVAVFVLPLAVIMHYVTRWKSTRGLSDEEQQTLEDLWRNAERMNARIETLETILDEQGSNWKKSP
jgi:phage shock protein B